MPHRSGTTRHQTGTCGRPLLDRPPCSLVSSRVLPGRDPGCGTLWNRFNSHPATPRPPFWALQARRSPFLHVGDRPRPGDSARSKMRPAERPSQAQRGVRGHHSLGQHDLVDFRHEGALRLFWRGDAQNSSERLQENLRAEPLLDKLVPASLPCAPQWVVPQDIPNIARHRLPLPPKADAPLVADANGQTGPRALLAASPGQCPAEPGGHRAPSQHPVVAFAGERDSWCPLRPPKDLSVEEEATRYRSRETKECTQVPMITPRVMGAQAARGGRERSDAGSPPPPSPHSGVRGISVRGQQRQTAGGSVATFRRECTRNPARECRNSKGLVRSPSPLRFEKLPRRRAARVGRSGTQSAPPRSAVAGRRAAPLPSRPGKITFARWRPNSAHVAHPPRDAVAHLHDGVASV